MKGDAQVIGHLQAQLKNELTAINQYFLHYRMLKHWGFDKLAKKEYSESIGEMKHADWLMDRIFTLDGLPNLQDLAKIQVGEDVPEILACDLRAEQGAQATIKEGIAHCESVRDYVSRDLLQKRPALLARFIEASAEGWKSYLADPAPGNALIRKANPQMSDELLAYGYRKMKEYKLVDGGDAATHGLLSMTDARWQATLAFLREAKLAQPGVDYTKAWTLELARDTGVRP